MRFYAGGMPARTWTRVVELITDVLCSNRSTYRIGGEDLPIAQVKGRFYKLDSGHLEYVFDCLRKNTTQIRNIRAYLLTAAMLINC